ncbi:MAG: lysylphosphatidylglycerol synthase transmembrane domain-containing protein [Acidimicrobiia bacterium]|nr:lysylphosphatidylglycerol synthase transmembrane domain-containing protein [Acidimicrobiia bacterium]
MGVLFWQVRDEFTWSQLVPEWTPEAWLWLLGAGAVMFLGFFLSTVRWQQVLASRSRRAVRIRRLFSHFLAGQFISAFLPGTVGGDVVRMTRLTRDTGTGPTSFASVVLERLTGWIVLPVLTFARLPHEPGAAACLAGARAWPSPSRPARSWRWRSCCTPSTTHGWAGGSPTVAAGVASPAPSTSA